VGELLACCQVADYGCLKVYGLLSRKCLSV
jgi:hypothetical protein